MLFLAQILGLLESKDPSPVLAQVNRQGRWWCPRLYGAGQENSSGNDVYPISAGTMPYLPHLLGQLRPAPAYLIAEVQCLEIKLWQRTKPLFHRRLLSLSSSIFSTTSCHRIRIATSPSFQSRWLVVPQDAIGTARTR